jgi:hypothetical protein
VITLKETELAKAFGGWFEHCEKSTKIAGSYAKKN